MKFFQWTHKRRIFVAVILSTFILTASWGFWRTHSENKLRDIPMTENQNKAFAEADAEIEKQQQQLQSALSSRYSMAKAFAISNGIPADELTKFKVEKKGDIYHFLEMSAEEISKSQQQQAIPPPPGK